MNRIEKLATKPLSNVYVFGEWCSFHALRNNDLKIVDQYGKKIKRVRAFKECSDCIYVKVLIMIDETTPFQSTYIDGGEVVEWTAKFKHARLVNKR